MVLAHILLIHGAFADGSSWSKVIPHLQAAGHNVTAVQQPLTSLADDIRTVKTSLQTLTNQLGDSNTPIVVAAHSFGGFVMTNAVTEATPNVKSLVYVMAFAPDEGETVTSLGQNHTPLPSYAYFTPDAAGRLSLPQPEYLKYFAPDVERAEAQVLAATQGPSDAARFEFVSGKPAWRQVEAENLHYVVAQKDQLIQPELEAFMAKRMGAKTYELEGASHAGLWSQGQRVAEIILEAVKGC